MELNRIFSFIQPAVLNEEPQTLQPLTEAYVEVAIRSFKRFVGFT